jgi:hypothetical protein
MANTATNRDTVPVGGVWLTKKPEHLGGDIQLQVEIDGEWRLLGTWANDDGPISHIIEPAGIRSATGDAQY